MLIYQSITVNHGLLPGQHRRFTWFCHRSASDTFRSGSCRNKTAGNRRRHETEKKSGNSFGKSLFTSSPSFQRKKQIPDILQPALLMIDNSPSKNFTIQKLASACGLSESTFRRYFRNAFGISPAVYIRNRRLKLSAEMLCSSKEQIKGIALRCGFPAAQYFSAVFKTHYGITPADYRRQQRQAFAASQ